MLCARTPARDSKAFRWWLGAIALFSSRTLPLDVSKTAFAASVNSVCVGATPALASALRTTSLSPLGNACRVHAGSSFNAFFATVLALVAGGLLNKQIAAEIGLAEITVKIHRGHLMKKMGAKSLADLVRMAEILGVRRTKP